MDIYSVAQSGCAVNRKKDFGMSHHTDATHWRNLWLVQRNGSMRRVISVHDALPAALAAARNNHAHPWITIYLTANAAEADTVSRILTPVSANGDRSMAGVWAEIWCVQWNVAPAIRTDGKRHRAHLSVIGLAGAIGSANKAARDKATYPYRIIYIGNSFAEATNIRDLLGTMLEAPSC